MELIEELKGGIAEYLCSCGCYTVKRKGDVERGRTKSCGCLKHSQQTKFNIGDKIYNLTIAKDLGIIKGQRKCLFTCICGNETEGLLKEVKRGRKKSCGCIGIDSVKKANTTHGKTKSNLYNRYMKMKARCYNKKNTHYKYYGGKGVKICDEWLGENGFLAFEKWSLENGYSPELSIDRINVNGDYEPSNCRWTTSKVQSNNTTYNRVYIIDNQKLTLKQISEKFNIPYARLHKRVHSYGYTIEQAIEKN